MTNSYVIYRLPLGLALCLLVATIPLGATVYRYHPSSPLKMGGGFDPLRPDRAFAKCLEETGAVRISPGSPETTLDVSLVKSRRELYHHLNIDASLSASYGLFSASASFSLDEEYSFGETDVMWTVKAMTDYGRFGLENPKLNELGRNLRRDLRFPEHCGREYVSQERRVAQAVAIYSLHTLTESQRTEVHAALSASFKGNVFAVGGNVKLDEITSKLRDLYALKISVYALGGAGVTKLKDLTVQTTLPEVQKILQDYVSSLTLESATPIEFVTASWQSLGVPLSPPEMTFRHTVLSEYYFLYRDIQDRLRLYGERLRPLMAVPPGNTTTQQEMNVLTQQYGALSLRLQAIQEKALECLEPTASEKMNISARETEASVFPNTRKDANIQCKLNLDFTPLPPVPSAVFEERWVRIDPLGKPYTLELWYEGPNLPAQNDFHFLLTTGVLENPATVRFVSFEVIEPPANTQNLFTRLIDNQRSVSLARHWNANQQRERIRITYEVLQRQCVRFCFGVN